MVYVDELQRYPHARRPFHEGSCHMWADDEAELHAMAQRIGLKREWFQKHRFLDHYDLTPRRREAAVRAGAVEHSVRKWMREKRKR